MSGSIKVIPENPQDSPVRQPLSQAHFHDEKTGPEGLSKMLKVLERVMWVQGVVNKDHLGVAYRPCAFLSRTVFYQRSRCAVGS